MGQVQKYQIKQGDTLQGIAKKFFGDAERWYEIAFYNNLTYPFFTNDLTWTNTRKAIGEVTFSITGMVASAGFGGTPFGSSPFGSPGGYPSFSIPIGSIVVTTPVSVFGTTEVQQKFYVTLQPVLLDSTHLTETIAVEAIEDGDVGNTPELTVNILYSPVFADVSVINYNPITGGESINITKPGDMILIPIEVLSSEPALNINTIEEAYDMLFGEDFYLFDSSNNWAGATAINTDLIMADLIPDEFGDIKSIAGMDNLQQALILRYITNPGEIPRHPDFGSNLNSMIGRSGTSMMMRMMNLEAAKTARSDPRIVDAQDIIVTKNPNNMGGDVFGITGKIVVIGEDEAIPIDMVLSGGQ